MRFIFQEHIVRLYEAYQNDTSVVLVFEKLFGENVARSLSLKNRYSEQQVSAIIKQVSSMVSKVQAFGQHSVTIKGVGWD